MAAIMPWGRLQRVISLQGDDDFGLLNSMFKLILVSGPVEMALGFGNESVFSELSHFCAVGKSSRWLSYSAVVVCLAEAAL